MGKQHESKKEPKRKAALSLKERRAAKKAKKMEQAGHRLLPEEKPTT